MCDKGVWGELASGGEDSVETGSGRSLKSFSMQNKISFCFTFRQSPDCPPPVCQPNMFVYASSCRR